MTLQQLRYLIEVAQSGSFNAAAHELYVSQSTLSMAIKDLESELGVSIFLRSNRGLTLRKYNEIIEQLNAEMEKCGFTDYEAGNILKEGTSSKTRQKCYINDNAGANGMMIKVENLGYRTFYIEIYEKGDWNPSK